MDDVELVWGDAYQTYYLVHLLMPTEEKIGFTPQILKLSNLSISGTAKNSLMSKTYNFSVSNSRGIIVRGLGENGQNLFAAYPYQLYASNTGSTSISLLSADFVPHDISGSKSSVAESFDYWVLNNNAGRAVKTVTALSGTWEAWG